MLLVLVVVVVEVVLAGNSTACWLSHYYKLVIAFLATSNYVLCLARKKFFSILIYTNTLVSGRC